MVGPCASGKSTLVTNLRARGFDAHVSGQEHSEIANLWQRMEPDVLIGLNLDLETLRARRGQSWSERLFQTQQRRLANAFAAADVVLDTSSLDQGEVIARVINTFTLKGDNPGQRHS